jgi:hypothetical protein
VPIRKCLPVFLGAWVPERPIFVRCNCPPSRNSNAQRLQAGNTRYFFGSCSRNILKGCGPIGASIIAKMGHTSMGNMFLKPARGSKTRKLGYFDYFYDANQAVGQ